MSIRVLIADDQPLVLRGLEKMVNGDPEMSVVGTAEDGAAAVHLARSLRPDVCLLDIRMPSMNGIEATQALAGRAVDRPLAVVLITTFDLDEYVHRGLKAGARGFLLKDAGPELVRQAIRSAARGDALIAPSITARFLAAFAEASARRPPEPSTELTRREEEVLRALALGQTNAEIGEALSIRLSTVKAHVASLMEKIDARNRVELAMWAHETHRLLR
ncbi:MAG: response regulator transcription factor [Myxococcota bacterium]